MANKSFFITSSKGTYFKDNEDPDIELLTSSEQNFEERVDKCRPDDVCNPPPCDPLCFPMPWRKPTTGPNQTSNESDEENNENQQTPSP
jgi:hypothetical protein